MRECKRQSRFNNEDGLAMLETIPLLVIFVVLLAFGMGLFGVIHTAVLHSISARAYSFETFRQRTNLYYFREDGSGLSNPQHYHAKGWRFHAISSPSDLRSKFVATDRPIAFGRSLPPSDASDEEHNAGIREILPRNDRISVNPAWIMVGYGLCLNANCGN